MYIVTFFCPGEGIVKSEAFGSLLPELLRDWYLCTFVEHGTVLIRFACYSEDVGKVGCHLVEVNALAFATMSFK